MNFSLSIFTLGFIFFINTSIYAQKEVKEVDKNFIKKINLEIGVLPFRAENEYLDIIINGHIYSKLNLNWYVGIEYYKLFRIPSQQSWVFSDRENFFMYGPIVRYYFNKINFNAYWEGSLETGNVCHCSLYIPNYIKATYILPNRYFLANALGIEFPLKNSFSFTVSLKTFYMLNNLENKLFHTRPFLNFRYQFGKFKKNKAPIIHNPRF